MAAPALPRPPTAKSQKLKERCALQRREIQQCARTEAEFHQICLGSLPLGEQAKRGRNGWLVSEITDVAERRAKHTASPSAPSRRTPPRASPLPAPHRLHPQSLPRWQKNASATRKPRPSCPRNCPLLVPCKAQSWISASASTSEQAQQGCHWRFPLGSPLRCGLCPRGKGCHKISHSNPLLRINPNRDSPPLDGIQPTSNIKLRLVDAVMRGSGESDAALDLAIYIALVLMHTFGWYQDNHANDHRARRPCWG